VARTPTQGTTGLDGQSRSNLATLSNEQSMTRCGTWHAH
jgi:hypothetical protein